MNLIQRARSQVMWVLVSIVTVIGSVGAVAPALGATPGETYFVGDGPVFDVALEIDEGGKGRLFLTTSNENAPVVGATITLQVAGVAADVMFSAARQPGVYEAPVVQADQGPGVLTVQTEADVDAIELSVPTYRQLATKAAAISPAAVPPTGWKTQLGYGTGGALIGALLTWLILRGRRSATLACLALIVAGSLTPRPALAHEGHQHGGDESAEPASTENAGTAVVMAKRSQLLVGLRTVVAKTGESPAVLQAYGHVGPKPQNDAIVAAPQSGFLRDLRALLPGQVVRRGETLGSLQAVSTIPLQSPLDGQITEVEAVEGARVEAGAKLFRVTNLSTLWVDAELFQAQLASLADVEKVTVTIDGSPKGVVAKIVNAPTPINEATRTAKVMLELTETPKGVRVGSFARIRFALKARQAGVVLPADAVLNRAGERLVFVKTGPETFAARPVTVSEAAEPGMLVVTAGVADGDRVVTTGNYQLLLKAK